MLDNIQFYFTVEFVSIISRVGFDSIKTTEHLCAGQVFYFVLGLSAQTFIRFSTSLKVDMVALIVRLRESLLQHKGHTAVFGNQEEELTLRANQSVAVSATAALGNEWDDIHLTGEGVWPSNILPKLDFGQYLFNFIHVPVE